MYRVRAYASGQVHPAVQLITPSAKTAFGALHDLMAQTELVTIHLIRDNGQSTRVVVELARQGVTWVEPAKPSEGE